MARKEKPAQLMPGDSLWVMALNIATPLGGVTHVSPGDKLYRSREECQRAIDEMSPWIGMPNRERYRPIALSLA